MKNYFAGLGIDLLLSLFTEFSKIVFLGLPSFEAIPLGWSLVFSLL